ncbi:MAG: aurora kinase A-interacting protein [Proteobacteria bacterium]|nr:aurora kinase A-interacting protein [Pseudomonadota bacterium]
MGSVLKWRKKKIRKHKYRKLRRKTRHQRRK